MSVRLVVTASRRRSARAAEARLELVAPARGSAEVVEPHQQPGTTHARWIGRSSAALVPIVVRGSMGDDSPQWPTSRGRDAISEG